MWAGISMWAIRQCHLQVHGFPKVMGVLTHLDGFKDQKKLKKTKKALKHRFWAEIYQGASNTITYVYSLYMTCMI